MQKICYIICSKTLIQDYISKIQSTPSLIALKLLMFFQHYSDISPYYVYKIMCSNI